MRSHLIGADLRRLHELVVDAQHSNAIFFTQGIGAVNDVLLCSGDICLRRLLHGLCLRRRYRRFAGVRLFRFDLYTFGIAVPADIEADLFANVPQLHIVVAVDDIGFHLHFFSIYDNAMVTALCHDPGSIRRGSDASQQQTGEKTGCKTSSLHRVYLQSLLMGSWYRKSWWVSKNIEALELSKSFYTNDHHSISSFFSCLHTPAVIRLIHHAGDKGDDVLRAVV